MELQVNDIFRNMLVIYGKIWFLVLSRISWNGHSIITLLEWKFTGTVQPNFWTNFPSYIVSSVLLTLLVSITGLNEGDKNDHIISPPHCMLGEERKGEWC